jgi:ADP-ribosylglycohydrolase
VSKICYTIHQWFDGMKKYSYPFNEQKIPKNGIYILFEKGEFAHTTNRIVRIGTHTGKNKLPSRLKEHFVNENKDRSIFRKNIGRALLNKDNDPFIEQWNKKALILDSVDFIKQKEIEKRVTKYIRSNFSFVIFQIEDKKKMHELESKIISTVSLCGDCTPYPNWLGLFSPVEKIRRSGLWLVDELWKTPLSEDDLKELKNILWISGHSERRIKLLISKYQGCLLGLAIGDALGAPVEFLRLQEIKKRYGKDGIADFHGWRGFKPGSYTDDTQMSLATAVGCIRAYQRWSQRGICHPASVVHHRYLDWLESQNDPDQRRGPGSTCLSALRSGKMGTIEEKINDSKGCGGVMRTAPVGLAFPPDRAFKEGAEYAAITHGHPSGYLTAGFLSGMISYIILGKTLAEAIDLCIGQLIKYDGHSETLEKIELAQKLSVSQKSIEEAIQTIGEGWVGEEALAISVYCSLKFSDNWGRGTLAAVNHSGDSDSTGSITGAILGTLLSVELIPGKWVRDVEESDRIKKIANDMFNIFKNGKALSFEEYPPF